MSAAAPQAVSQVAPTYPAYVRQVVDRSAPLRRWWLDLLLRRTVKRALRHDVSIALLRDKQAALDRRLTRLDPAARYTPAPCDGVAAEWVEVPESRPDRVLFYIHGGAWMFKFPHIHHAMVGRWCRALGARALMVDYRLAPEARFPAGIDDCWAAWCALRAQGVAARDIVLAGDSAGGNLSLALLHRIKAAAGEMPACAVLLSPFVDFTLSSQSMVSNAARDPMFSPAAMVALRHYYLDPEQMLHPDASPLFADFAGLPPLFFQAGESEMLRDESLRAAARAHAAGVPVEVELWHHMPHVFQALQSLPHGAPALRQIVDFIHRHSAWGAAAA